MDLGTERVIALVDMDCFYVQVEQRINPELKNKPCVVAQYKTWKGGGIIAVSYEARAHGVTRNMWADDARTLCPDLQVARVRESHGKADLTHYREASVEVIEVMSRFAVIERASIDEAYMDLTASVEERLKHTSARDVTPQLLRNTHVQGFPQTHTGDPGGGDAVLDKDALRAAGVHEWLDQLSCSPADLRLALGALIVEETRAAVEEHTGFRCSAGISHNKVLAKLACGLNKPNRQTVLPLGSVPQLFHTLPIRNIRNLGGKLGASITQTLGVENMGDLARVSRVRLEQLFGEKTGPWLFDLCRGIEFEPVKPRHLPKSIGCSKNFPGKTSLVSKQQVQHWLHQLALELEERLNKDRDMNGRVAKQLTVGVRQAGDKRASSFSRCCALVRYDAAKMTSDGFAIIKSLNTAGSHQEAWSPALTCLLLSASKFSDVPSSSSGGITSFLSSDVSSTQTPKTQPAPKSPGAIQSLFEKAAERNKRRAEENVPHTPVENTPSRCRSQKASGISSFFQRKSLEKNLKLSEGNGHLRTKDEDHHVCVEPSSSKDLQVCEKPSSSKDLQVCEEPGFSEDEDLQVCEKPSSSKDLQVCEKPSSSKDLQVCVEPSFSEDEDLQVCEKPSSSKDLQVCVEPSFSEDLQVCEKPSSSKDLQVCEKPSSSKDLQVCVEPSFSEDLQVCERCGQRVLVWEMPEHTDYHFALDLQKSFSSSASSDSPVPARAPLLPHGKSRTRIQTGPQAKRARVQGNSGTLDSFFKKM
ncbi:DNA polymerase eta isoform X3 [Pimephales promelas]|uniref:DNA polymerase eta isoform X3 n=1 Tax=Pimephales promelas TaxID=90988 RepID=UPI00195599BA|nr:DNA polymerase eta isoform X3 [Pimephales promelas]